MYKSYTKDDFFVFAKGMIEDLLECDDGTIMTTRQLAYASGFDDMTPSDFISLHNALFKEAKTHHITLEMVAHENKAGELPFNLPFIVRNKQAQIKCPHCGSKNTARYLYGLPSYSEEMEQKLNAGKLIFGGCCISSVEVNGEDVSMMPSRKCNDCQRNFATKPHLITPENDTVEDYRDIVTGITFSLGGYFDGYTDITIKKNDKGALVSVRETWMLEEIFSERQITKGKWQQIVNTLYDQMYLHEWKKSFVDPDVLDGTQWQLEISLTRNRKRAYDGSNAYPSYWHELLEIFREFAKV